MNKCETQHYFFDPSLHRVDVQGHCDVDNVIEDQKYFFYVHEHAQGTLSLWLTEAGMRQIDIFCADESVLTVRLFLLFVPSATITISIYVCGEKSSCFVYGAYALSGNDQAEVIVRQVHCGENSTSQFFLDGLVSGQASFRFDGLITIAESAKKSSALQNNKNILLSHGARVVSVPSIQVLQNDVKCYHGAAIGYFERSHQEYFRSRGLDEYQIKKMLIAALYGSVLQGCEKREFILQKIYEKI
jgi:Fe-S cluster assembly protein SufD